MFGSVAGAAFSQILSTRYGWLVIPVIFGLAVSGALQTHNEVERLGDQRRAARALWFSECSKPVDECAIAWDSSHTLRDMYVERVPLN